MGRHKKGENVNGWLIIDKPRDMGSTDVVNFTRRLFNACKNGHGGTLDPFATGVLPIAFGEATKLLSYLTDAKKEYEFTIQWGKATSTGDTEGNIIAEKEKIPSRDEILSILPEFKGIIEQVPPAYSAIKINGRRAYDLARKGEKIEMPSRQVEIYDLELLTELPEHQAVFHVACSKGTYVRTLGQDIALRLGTVGHLKELRRTKCGNFSLSDAIKLETLKNIVHIDSLTKVLLPIETYLRDIAVIAVSEADAAKLRLGQGLSPRTYETELPTTGDAIALCNGKMVAVVRVDNRKIAPIRVFNL